MTPKRLPPHPAEVWLRVFTEIIKVADIRQEGSQCLKLADEAVQAYRERFPEADTKETKKT